MRPCGNAQARGDAQSAAGKGIENPEAVRADGLGQRRPGEQQKKRVPDAAAEPPVLHGAEQDEQRQEEPPRDDPCGKAFAGILRGLPLHQQRDQQQPAGMPQFAEKAGGNAVRHEQRDAPQRPECGERQQNQSRGTGKEQELRGASAGVFRLPQCKQQQRPQKQKHDPAVRQQQIPAEPAELHGQVCCVQHRADPADLQQLRRKD